MLPRQLPTPVTVQPSVRRCCADLGGEPVLGGLVEHDRRGVDHRRCGRPGRGRARLRGSAEAVGAAVGVCAVEAETEADGRRRAHGRRRRGRRRDVHLGLPRRRLVAGAVAEPAGHADPDEDEDQRAEQRRQHVPHRAAPGPVRAAGPGRRHHRRPRPAGAARRGRPRARPRTRPGRPAARTARWSGRCPRGSGTGCAAWSAAPVRTGPARTAPARCRSRLPPRSGPPSGSGGVGPPGGPQLGGEGGVPVVDTGGRDAGQTSKPSRRADLARWRDARNRRSRFTSMGSQASASGRSMRALSTW